MVAGVMHGHDDIISPRALDDRRRPPIDHGVEDPPRSVVDLVCGVEDAPFDGPVELLHSHRP